MSTFWWVIIGVFGGSTLFAVIIAVIFYLRDAKNDKKILSKYYSLKKSSLQEALEYLVHGMEHENLNSRKYREELLDLANNQGMAKAMAELHSHYVSQAALCEKWSRDSNDKDQRQQYAKNALHHKDQAAEWKMKAAQAGDINCIMDYYDFKDYDFKNAAYGEILQALDKAQPVTNYEAGMLNYLRGIAYYRSGDIASAKKIFMSSTFVDKANQSKCMYIQCLLNEFNIIESIRLYSDLESSGWEIPTEIKGTYYYSLAFSYYEGKNGLQKDIKKAYASYKKAVEYGESRAMLPFGKFLLMGEVENVAVSRDYLTANKFICNAERAGNTSAHNILEKYGVDGAIVIPLNDRGVTYHFMDGYVLTAESNIIKWLQLISGLGYKSYEIRDSFSSAYSENITSFNQLIDGIYVLYAYHIALMLQWGVRVLMKFNIDTYDNESILDECADLSLLPRVPQFEQRLQNIDNRALQLNLNTAYVKATRGKWVGGGIGTTISGTIAASIKGSVTAGVMNIGSGILHGIGDSIVKAMNNSEIKKMERDLFENKNTKAEFSEAIRSACFDVGQVIRKIIEQHHRIKLTALKGNIEYQGESLKDYDDRALNSKINNNYSVGKHEYVYALLLEKLRRQPKINDTVNQLYQVTLKRNGSVDVINQYVGDFGLSLNS